MTASSEPSPCQRLPYGVAVLMLAGLYAVLGIGVLWLALPVHFVAIFMPPVGVSLAALMMRGYRMSLGVWLGASLVMLWLLVKMDGGFQPSQLVGAAFNGLCLTLQSVAGLFLVRRAVGPTPKLQTLRELLWVLLLGGPVACVINASLAVPTLVAAGKLDPAEAVPFWFLVWSCDLLGVLVMLPITLVACDWPAGAWLGGRVKALAPPVGCVLVALVLYVTLARREDIPAQKERMLQVEFAGRAMEAQLRQSLRWAAAAGHLLEPVERRVDSWRQDLERVRQGEPGLRWVAWAPRRVAEDGAESYPLAVVAPASRGQELAGVELLSMPGLRPVVLEAVAKDQLTVSPWLALPGSSGEANATLVLVPLHDAAGAPAGVLALAMLPQEVMDVRQQPLVDPILAASLRFTLWDVSAPEAPRLLCAAAGCPREDTPVLLRVPLEAGGRKWELQAQFMRGRRRRFPNLELWGLMGSFLLFTGLLAVLLMQKRSEKVRVVSLVAERTNLLRQRELFLSAVLQSALDGLLTLDEEGRVLSANHAACQLLGRSAAEWEGLALTEVLPGLEWASLRAELEGQARQPLGLRREAEARRRDGSTVMVELALSNVSAGEWSTYVLLLHDVSERARVVRMKDEFISTVSHELRTPLTSILGSLSLVNRGGTVQLADVAPQLLTIAENNAQRLLALINDLLDVDKMEAGQLALECKPTELKPVLVRSLDENRGYAERFQVSLHLLPGVEEGLWAALDGNRFAQVMSNLLSNAIKFSPPGGQVEVGLAQEEDWVEVRVRDHGVGIPAEFQPLMFRKFSQADSSDTRRQRGTGLGLYLTRMLVEGMDGTIRFQTEPGQGTTFFVRLPRIPGAEQPRVA